MSGERFYSATLSEGSPSATWNPEEGFQNVFKLVIKQLLLGRAAKDDEYNVVEVETTTLESESVKVPIAVLKIGESRCALMELEFPDQPVIFRLIEGSGPVHILGQNILIVEEIVEEEVEEEIFDEDEGEDEGDTDGHQKKKRKLSQNSRGSKSTSNIKNTKKK